MNPIAGNPPNAATSVLRSVFSGLSTVQRQDGLGKIIQLTAAKSSVGTSYVARNLALLASHERALAGGRVALLDCDVQSLAQSQYFFAPQRVHDMSGPYDATYGQVGFWAAMNSTGQQREINDLCAFYLDNHTGLAVSTILTQSLMADEGVIIRDAPQYWQNLQSKFDFIFIDTPAFDRSSDAIRIAPLCDSTILIADANDAESTHHHTARDSIVQAGGRYEGLLLNAGMPMQLVAQA